ncbi:hypothetical protein DICPUDRAFT_99067 [Dictyostelium purpureum]|uniref:EGF-like domain-containing protein n=1 Tax=Dictyostelium purpureum TaxID=5786 RepID=F0ZVW1_DICPU|nr:uncharacterized protein DICPUDRAFT_99067 [Dictyostelium purpureum]EGC31914.1 hypothetical protein DICPUDRAFT_99067 [Dictyostelium purpureum]|eukprot:XP_003291551.1 hypothetical protein DICPUDRAFT_99067 [Dictyostelium purpureum]
MNYHFVFLFLVSFIFCINSQKAIPLNYYKNDLNGHYYQVVNQTLNPILATEYCSKQTYNNKKGYIATFTSEEEWNWAWSNGINMPGSWISGSDVPKTGVWHWSIGAPEELQPWYNLYFDKCYTFCLFGSVEPNLIEGEHWIHTSGSLTFPYLNNNGINAVINNVVCEYGGLEEPFVPSSPTSGSTIIVSNLGGYDIPTLSITFTGRDGTTSNFQAINIEQINSTHAYATIGTGQGKYYVMVSDGKGKKLEQNQLWHYELPYVGGVFPAFNKGGIATITGANFGIDASKISLTLGYASPVACENVKIIQENEAFTCTLAADLTDKFLPITILVSGSKFVSYKAAVYYPSNNLYYSGFVSSSTFITSMNNYSSSLRIDGQIGTIGVFDSKELFDFMNKVLPVPSTNTPWLLWQNARYDPATKGWFYLAGPKKDLPLTLYYTNVVGDQNTWSANSRFIINMNDLSIQAFSGSASTFTQFGGYAPTFPEVITHMVSPAGGKVDLKIDNYGTVFSTIKVLYRGLELPFERDYINGELDVIVPAGFGGPDEINVIVDNLQTPAKTQFIEYSGPEITNINRVPTTGGKVTIDGKYFSNTLDNTILNFGGVACSNLAYSEQYSQLTCDLVPGSGSLTVSLTIAAKSTAYNYQYQNPTVSSANNIPNVGSLVTVTGTNFGSNKDDISISIGSYTCSNVVIVTDHQKITCSAPVGTPGTYGLVVTVKGLPSTAFSVYYFASGLSTVQNGVDLDINGQDLPNASELAIKIGQVDISSNCVGSGSKLVCTNLPLQLTSGSLAITKGSDIYPPISVVLNPYITSISNDLLDTLEDSVITINGRYFETTTNQIQNTIQILNENGIAFASNKVNRVSSEVIALTINGGYGKDHELLVQVDTRKSNTLGYSFYPPELSTVEQIGAKIIVTGNNFTTDSEVTTLTFNSEKQELVSIKTNEIIFNLDGLSKNGQVYVEVGNQKSNTLQLDIRPSLSSVSPNIIPMNGPTVITIVGNYLNSKDANGQDISIEFFYQLTTEEDSPKEKLDNCQEISVDEESKLYTFTCDMVSGYGYYSISASSTSPDQTLETNTISNLSYESPIVGLSTSLYQNEGGNVTIGASNFNIKYTQVFIGGKECTNPIEVENKSKIQCYFSADVEISNKDDSLTIEVISAKLSGSNNGFVYSLLYDCLNNCSSNGDCDKKTGNCICHQGFIGKDCSNIQPNSSSSSMDSSSSENNLPPPFVDEDGTTIFPGTKINFTVSISHLRELDIENNHVKALKLSTIKWVERNSTGNHYYYKGTFENDPAIFELDIRYFETEQVIEFGGEKLTMPENSIKYQVSVSQWSFATKFNTLQTIYHSKTNKVSVFNCEEIVSTTEVGTNQFQINTGNGYLSAKFSSRMIIDDSKYSKTEISTLDQADPLYNDFTNVTSSKSNEYHVLTSMNSPFFQSKVILDPSFSSFFRIEEKTECGSSSKWKLAVIISLSVAGGTSVAVASFFVYKSKVMKKKALDSISMS